MVGHFTLAARRMSSSQWKENWELVHLHDTWDSEWFISIGSSLMEHTIYKVVLQSSDSPVPPVKVFFWDPTPTMTTVFIVLLNHQCAGGAARCHDTQLIPRHSNTSRSKNAELNLLYLSQDSASPWWRLFTKDKNMCLCVWVCVHACVCIYAFVNVQICVFFWATAFFFSNKYAQHIYCLYLGKIDGIAGEQNIYHFCLWLIVVLGMAALQRERERVGERDEVRDEREREKSRKQQRRKNERRGGEKISCCPGVWNS